MSSSSAWDPTAIAALCVSILTAVGVIFSKLRHCECCQCFKLDCATTPTPVPPHHESPVSEISNVTDSTNQSYVIDPDEAEKPNT